MGGEREVASNHSGKKARGKDRERKRESGRKREREGERKRKREHCGWRFSGALTAPSEGDETAAEPTPLKNLINFTLTPRQARSGATLTLAKPLYD